MLTWGEFRQDRPDLEAAARELFCFFGVGLGFLATVRPDGGPRLHPICVIVTPEALFGLIIPSLKLHDLLRDGRYSLHSYPLPDNEDAFYVTGQAEPRLNQAHRQAAIGAFLNQPGRQGPPLTESSLADQTLVEFLIDSCLLTRTTGHGDSNPQHIVWRSPA